MSDKTLGDVARAAFYSSGNVDPTCWERAAQAVKFELLNSEMPTDVVGDVPYENHSVGNARFEALVQRACLRANVKFVGTVFDDVHRYPVIICRRKDDYRLIYAAFLQSDNATIGQHEDMLRDAIRDAFATAPRENPYG